MKKVKKLTMRSLSVLVALMLCVGLLGTTVFAADEGRQCNHCGSTNLGYVDLGNGQHEVQCYNQWIGIGNESHTYVNGVCIYCQAPEPKTEPEPEPDVDKCPTSPTGYHLYGAYTDLGVSGHIHQCDYCDHTELDGHTMNGSACKNCGHSEIWGVAEHATCEDNGVETWTCPGCGESGTRDIPAIGHAYDGAAWKAISDTEHEMVCANDSSHTKTGDHDFERINPIQERCKDCGYVQTGVIQLPDEPTMPTVCTHDNAVIIEEVSATCTDTGWTEGLYCPDCETVLVVPVETEIDPNNHADVVTDDAVAPTCILTGLTEGSHCEACSEILVAQVTIPATGHTFGAWVVVRAATTEQTGLRVSTCIHGDAQVEEEIPMLDDETEDPEIEIPEEDVPLTPNPEDPEIEIPEEDVPLTSNPEEPEIEVPEEDVPLAPGPEDEEIEIPEDDVPLAAVPQTGDYSYVWGFFALISGAALAMLVITNKKREENV